MVLHVRIFLFASLVLWPVACANISNELRGDARPGAGTVEEVPQVRVYGASFDTVWQAVSDILDNQDIIFQGDNAAGRIETEQFHVQKVSGWSAMFAGSDYKAKEYITIRVDGNGTSVRFRARFTKEFMKVMVTEDKRFPEAENFLRKKFFEELDAALQAGSPPQATPQQQTQRTAPQSIPESKASSSPPSGLNRAQVITAGANIRSGPSTKHQVIATVTRGQTVEVKGRQGQWLMVITPSGKEGWAHESRFGASAEPVSPARKSPEPSPQPEVREDPARRAQAGQTETRPPAAAPAPPPRTEKAPEPPPTPQQTQGETAKTSQGRETETRAAAQPPPAKTEKAPEAPQQPEKPAEPKQTQRPPEPRLAKEQPKTEPATSPKGTGKYLRIWDEGPADIYKDANPFSGKLGSIPAGTKIQYLDKKGNFYIIDYKGSKGYIYQDLCKDIE